MLPLVTCSNEFYYFRIQVLFVFVVTVNLFTAFLVKKMIVREPAKSSQRSTGYRWPQKAFQEVKSSAAKRYEKTDTVSSRKWLEPRNDLT